MSQPGDNIPKAESGELSNSRIIGGETATDEHINPDLEMFMDVNMALSIEVGRTDIKLRDLLNLTKGNVVELNKLAGEPLDIMANGKLIAYGEVVSVNGKYGVRLTSVASKSERTKSLKETK